MLRVFVLLCCTAVFPSVCAAQFAPVSIPAYLDGAYDALLIDMAVDSSELDAWIGHVLQATGDFVPPVDVVIDDPVTIDVVGDWEAGNEGLEKVEACRRVMDNYIEGTPIDALDVALFTLEGWALPSRSAPLEDQEADLELLFGDLWQEADEVWRDWYQTGANTFVDAGGVYHSAAPASALDHFGFDPPEEEEEEETPE